MSAVAVIPSLLPLLVVASMRRAEARIHRQLVDARAFTAESAIELSTKRSFDRRRLDDLIHGGAVRLAANRRHFLDNDGWVNYQRARHRRAMLAASVALALVGVGFGVAWSMR